MHVLSRSALLATMLACRRTCTPRAMCEPVSGEPVVRGDESLMTPKAHGSTATPVQQELRWGVRRELSDRICSFNREGAEPSGYFTECLAFTKQINWARGQTAEPDPITFYDSVTGRALFKAPVGRTMDAFLGESLRHGWPSFRQKEVIWEHVRVLEDLEVVSTAGTHLGHSIPDADGQRFCINLCSVAGTEQQHDGTGSSSSTSSSISYSSEGESASIEGAWPLLHAIAAAGTWTGEMHYATGTDGLSPAPFVLSGTLAVEIRGEAQVTVTSSVVLPSGIERVVSLGGTLGDEAGSVARLEKVGGAGPISLLLSEHTEASTLLLRELNATTGEAVVSSSIIVRDNELWQTAHELGANGAVGGVQMWRMSVHQQEADGPGSWRGDEEEFMTSGSML